MYGLKVKGDWDDTFSFLKKLKKVDFNASLDKIGREGVVALKNATPRDTGLACDSWDYVVNHGFGNPSIEWHNYDIEGGYSVIVLIEYGHGVHGGGYVQGRHFIDPALQPVFDEAIEKLREEVNKL